MATNKARKKSASRGHTGTTESGHLCEVRTERVGKVSIYKRGRTYYLYYREQSETVRRRVEGNLASARIAAGNVNAALGEGRPSPFHFERISPEHLVDEFVDYCKDVKDLAFRTVERYRAALGHFKVFAAARGVSYVDQITLATVEEFVKWLRKQCLTPYRSGNGGTGSVNSAIQNRFRKDDKSSELSPFYHSDKVIRISNWYRGWGAKRELVLSNGSLGLITGERPKRKYYFPDADRPFSYMDSDENLDLAYAITIHKSQGSDFEHVLLVIPERLALLNKELVYTALTRSRRRLTIFLQETRENLLEIARNRSSLLNRNTSIFSMPADNRRGYQPRRGVFVKSRIEYIIYKALERSGLQFQYEERLPLSKRTYDIKPDFTIHFRDGSKVFWEHLGMLDCRKYSRDWDRRLTDFKEHGVFDAVVTTDDLQGVDDEKIDKVIQDIRKRKPADTKGNAFSNHHYQLY